MKILFDSSFEKSISKLIDKKFKRRLLNLIELFEQAESLSTIPTLKKMSGFQNFYRVRLGNYRVGFELLEDNTVLFLIVAHRKDIYKYFP
jgi:mRNA interferase RelE/StbE